MRLKFLLAGMQRSGTTVFANLLARELNIPYLHEPFNPGYGLDTKSAQLLYQRLRNTSDEVRDLRWNFSRRSRLLHRPYLLNKYLCLNKNHSFFIKCPFLGVFYDLNINTIPIYFVYKDKDNFIRDNLKRGFNYKNFLREHKDLSILSEAYSESDDETRLGLIYHALLANASNGRTVELVHITSIPNKVNEIAKNISQNELIKSPRPIIYLNTIGRGMMKTGSSFDYNKRDK